MELFDSHSHYNDEKFNDNLNEIIDKTIEAGVTKFICAGYSLESSIKAVEISKLKSGIYSIIGISPNDVKESLEESLKEVDKIEELIKENKVVGIGEIGLDYYWNKENKEIQKQVFIKQIQLANKYNLPIIIHTREAVIDTINVLKENKCNNKGVIHCCPFNRELIKNVLDLGFYISFAGPVTFKNSKNAEEIVNLVPEDRILIETDSPYLAPEPVRGTVNDSRNVRYIAEKIATFKNKTTEEIAQITYKNAERIFNL